MKILICLVMLGVYHLGATENHAYPVDMDSGLIVVRHGEPRIDNQQYYVNIFTEAR